MTEIPQSPEAVAYRLMQDIIAIEQTPPIAPGGNGYPTNPVYFDTYGMTWKVGARARF